VRKNESPDLHHHSDWMAVVFDLAGAFRRRMEKNLSSKEGQRWLKFVAQIVAQPGNREIRPPR
jgi:hypothetical protein